MPNPAERLAFPPASRYFSLLHTDLAAAPDCAMLWARWVGFRLGMRGESSNRTTSWAAGTRALAPLALFVALALTCPPAGAHHSGAMFDMAHPITLTGVVTKVEWTNPHTFMYLDVKNDKGVAESWAIEINSPNFLRHNGWTSSTVSPGDAITVTGAPAKTGARFMHGTLVELSGGVQLRS